MIMDDGDDIFLIGDDDDDSVLRKINPNLIQIILG